MNITKIKISNLFGIKEQSLDGKSVELTGSNGVGKTSVLDAIKYALKNSSDRDYVIRDGEKEGEILIETDTGLYIDRKKRAQGSDYKSIKEHGREVQSPETFLKDFFTDLQLNPVEFTQMSKQQQNRTILDLIEFSWDINWIKEQFGEIPQGINYEQNILQVLNDIQSESSPYYTARQDINRDIRNNTAFVEEIAADIPQGYDIKKWEEFDLTAKLKELMTIKEKNQKIEEAKSFIESYDNKVRGYQGEREISIAAEEKNISNEREALLKNIEKMKAQIKADEDKLKGLDKTLEDKKKIANLEYDNKVAKLDESIERAKEFKEAKPIDTTELQKECDLAEGMKKHINEYNRMISLQKEIEDLSAKSAEFTKKIELARDLPRKSFRTIYYSN